MHGTPFFLVATRYNGVYQARKSGNEDPARSDTADHCWLLQTDEKESITTADGKRSRPLRSRKVHATSDTVVSNSAPSWVFRISERYKNRAPVTCTDALVPSARTALVLLPSSALSSALHLQNITDLFRCQPETSEKNKSFHDLEQVFRVFRSIRLHKFPF